jgi:small subunit ribosomal protein S8
MLTDPIADMLTRIRNGYLVKKSQVELPYSRVKEAILNLLHQEEFVESVAVDGEGKDKRITVGLKYDHKLPAVTKIRRISKPGQRVYRRSQDLPQVLSGQGLAIVTTPKGIMTAKQARKQNLGGEVICYVW